MPPYTPTDQLEKKKRLLIVGGIVAAAVLTLVLLLLGGGTGKTVTVEVLVVPSDASLTINGKSAKAGNLRLTEGQHTLKATRQHFGAAVKKIDTKKIDPDQPIYLTLDGSSPEAQAYMQAHPEEQALFERAIGVEIVNNETAILDSYPVVNQLPYETIDFLIDYTVSEENEVLFTVTLYPVAAVPDSDEYKQQLQDYKQQALQYLQKQGVNTSKANIVFSPNPDQ
jgi:hypothetical protein